MHPGIVLSMALLALVPRGEDLSKRYKATLDDNAPARPLEWTSSVEDVWSLKSFALERGDKLKLAFGASTLVLGASGTNAIWGVVVPKEPAKLEGSLGGGALVRSVLLRFHPRRLDDLFPASTVAKSGPPEALLWARRVVAHQLTETGFYWDQFPTPVTRGMLIVDCTCADGSRRVFDVDYDKGTVEVDARHTKSELPADVAMSKKDALDAFDDAWKAFDKQYAKFQLRPEVDWDALRKRFQPLAESSDTTWEAATAIALLCESLRDLHVHVKCGDEWMPGYWRYRPQNGIPDAAGNLIGELHDKDGDVRWARSKDGIGFVQVNGVGSDEVTKRFDAALEALADTWGLILDIRFNGGGGTDIAASVASRFVDQERVYAQSQYRVGSCKRTQLGDKKPRKFAPRAWRYEAPVVALFGQRCMSSGDELALMLVQCPQVTTMGDRTAGASAAPQELKLAGGITVTVPQWNDCDAAGKPYEDVGVPVKVPITNESSAFSLTKDPVIEAALVLLRKTPEAQRKPAHGK